MFPKKRFAKGTKRTGTRNRLEAAFEEWLKLEQQIGRVQWYAYESMKFKLGDGAWFTPDFAAMMADDSIVIFETKGFLREAANVRIKVAADKFPFKFVMVRHTRATGWTFEDM